MSKKEYYEAFEEYMSEHEFLEHFADRKVLEGVWIAACEHMENEDG